MRAKPILVLENKIENARIEKRIEELKQELNSIKREYYEKMYKILREIYTLRKSQFKRYTISSLANEKGIKLRASQIRYYFEYGKMSSKTKQLVKDGKLNTSTVLFVMRKNKKFEEPQIQNKVFEKIINHELNTSDITHIPSTTIIKRLDDKVIVNEDERIGIKLIYKLNEIHDSLKANSKNLSKELKLKLIRQLKVILADLEK